MSVAKRVADEMDGELIYTKTDRNLADSISPAWKASWLLDPIRGYDGTRNDILEIHDGWYVVARGNERQYAREVLDYYPR
jgi:hypothetical protein